MDATTTRTASTQNSNDANRVEIIIPDGRVANWRILANWLLAIPHWIMLVILGFIGGFVWLLLKLSVLLAGRVPGFCYSYLLGVARYASRVGGFAVFFVRSYPKFRFWLNDPVDTSGYQIQMHFYPNPGKVSRWRIFRPILAIPHFLVLGLLSLFQPLLILVGALTGLLTGRYPGWLRVTLQALATYHLRVSIYILAISNKYPRPW